MFMNNNYVDSTPITYDLDSTTSAGNRLHAMNSGRWHILFHHIQRRSFRQYNES